MSLPFTWREAFESFQDENKNANVPGRALEDIYQAFKARLHEESLNELKELGNYPLTTSINRLASSQGDT